MEILIKLDEVLEKCNDWESFCKKRGYSEYCVNEGGGDIEIFLSENDAKEFGIIKK